MELHFKEFMLLELFDSSVEIDWGTGASANGKWQGIFFIPVKGMNLDGAQALRQRQAAAQGYQRYATPPGHIKYVVNITTYWLKPADLQVHYDISRLNIGQGLLMADVTFKRWQEPKGVQKGYLTYERPGEGDKQPNDKLVFGTVLKAIQQVMEKGAKVTGIRFVSHQDRSSEESATKRLSTYKMLAKVIAPKYGFEQVPHLRDESDILLVDKKLFYPVAKIAPPTPPGQPRPPMAIPVGARRY